MRWLICLLMVVSMALAADEEAPKKEEKKKPDVPALVRQLGADTKAERDAASSALEKIGGPALRELRAALLKSTDAEIRKRARQLVDKIELRLFGEERSFSGHVGAVNAVAFT